MKTQEQIERKLENLKTDFIEKFVFNKEREKYIVVYETLKWVLKDTQENIEIESEV